MVACSPSEARELEVAGIKALMIQNGIAPVPRCESKKNCAPWKIIAVGRATAQKNPALFNRIAEAFADRKEFEFIWIGDGELRGQLSSPNIQVMGWKSQQEVLVKLREAHLYLSTSLWEGLPLSGLEAMSSGLPLLLRRCVGNVDLIQRGNGNLFENAADAIRQIPEMLLSPDHLKAMGEASRRASDEYFSLDKMTQGFGALYLNLANR